MRTTVRLPDALIERAKAEARHRNESLTALIEQGLELVLARGKGRVENVEIPLPEWHGGHVLPGVDLDDSSALLDLLERRQ